MLTIAVLDDEVRCVNLIRELTQKCMHEMNIRYVIKGYTKTDDLLNDFEQERYYDIYLLDIEMPGINGLEIARRIRRKLASVFLIYITNYVKYAIEAFEVNTYRYIPKQVLEQKLPEAYRSIQKQLDKRKLSRKYYVIEWYDKKIRILYDDIYCLRKEDKYVVIEHKNGSARVRKPLSLVVEELNSKDFYIIDRGLAVNLNQVSAVLENSVKLCNGMIFQVSKSRWRQLEELLLGEDI